MKLFFYDLETTGTMYWKNGIHQISGCIDIDGELKESFNFKVAPNPNALIDPVALEIGNVTEDQIKAYPDMKTVYKQIVKTLKQYVNKFDRSDKFFLVGYNNRGFDDNFFRAFFVQNDDPYFGSWFYADSHDALVLASRKLASERTQLENFKLKTVCKYVGIEVDETRLHDAAYDIDLTRQLYYKI